MNRKLTLILLLFTLATPLFAQGVSVAAKVDSVQLMIGEQTDLVLQVNMNKGQIAQFPVFTDTIVNGIELLESLPVDTLYGDNKERITLTKRYKITSFDANLYFIPHLEVDVDGETYQSESLSLKVETYDLEEADPKEFFGPKDILDPPFVWGDWIWLIVSVLLLAPLIYLIVYLVSRLLDNKPIIRRIQLTPKIPPHEEAMDKIEEIKSRRSWQSEGPKGYYTELTDVLRSYIWKRFGFNALEMTSSEIIAQLAQIEDKKQIEELRNLFTTADLVKFAKHNPLINENDANLMQAVDFINETKELPDPEAKPEPTEKVIVEKRSLQTKLLLGLGAALALAASLAALVYIVQEGADLLRSLF